MAEPMADPKTVAEGMFHSAEGKIPTGATEGEKLAAELLRGRSIRTVSGEKPPTVDSMNATVDRLIKDPTVNVRAKDILRDAHAIAQGGSVMENRLSTSPTLRKNLEGTIMSSPVLGEMYRGLTGAQKDIFLRGYLNRPETRDSIIKGMGVMSAENISKLFSGDTSARLEAELKVFGDELTVKTGRQAELKKQIDADEKELQEFETRAEGGKAVAGDLAAERSRIYADLAGEIDTAKYTAQADGFRASIASLEAQRAKYLTPITQTYAGHPAQMAGGSKVRDAMDPKIMIEHVDISSAGPAKDAVEKLDKEIAAYKTQLAELDAKQEKAVQAKAKAAADKEGLDSRKATLTARLAASRTELAAVDAKVSELTLGIAQRNADMLALENIDTRRAELIAQIESIPTLAFSETLMAEQEALANKQVEILKKAAEKVRDTEPGKARLAMLNALYPTPGGKISWAAGMAPTMAWDALQRGDDDAMMTILLGSGKAPLQNDHPDIYAQMVSEAKVQMARVRSRKTTPRRFSKVFGERSVPMTEAEQARLMASFKPSELHMLADIPGMRSQIKEATGIDLVDGTPIEAQLEGAGPKKWWILAILLGLPVVAAMAAAKKP